LIFVVTMVVNIRVTAPPNRQSASDHVSPPHSRRSVRFQVSYQYMGLGLELLPQSNVGTNHRLCPGWIAVKFAVSQPHEVNLNAGQHLIKFGYSRREIARQKTNPIQIPLGDRVRS
jgi:hypothetical protein